VTARSRIRIGAPSWTPGLVSVVVFLFIWEAVARAGVLPPLFLPAPSAIGATTARLLATTQFQKDILLTTQEFGTGYVLAILIGIPVGLAAGLFRRVFYAVNPFLSGLYAMPSIALLPWVSLMVGIDVTPKIIMAFLGASLPLAMATLRGVGTVDDELLTLSRSFLADRSVVIRAVILPSVVPFILAGLRIGLYGALGFTLVAEFITSQAGLGHRMQEAGNTFQTDIAFAGVFVIVVMALVLWFALGQIERYVLRWRPPM